MKKSEIFMGTLTAMFLILCGLYINLDMNKHQVKPCNTTYFTHDVEHNTSKSIYTNSTSILISESDPVPYTDQEIELLARVIMSEGSILPYHGKIGIMATIMNRVNSDKFPNTITEVIYQENQYSTAYNGDPTDECYQAINDYVDTGWPIDMFYFRTDYPHPFGKEYCHIGNTYFSTED
jgi:spore germination cell wall hydrolase CwlJ-like protein